MPAITIILLLGISQIIQRPRFLGFYVDIICRILLCTWFCFGYRGLFPIGKPLMYPTLEWSKSDLRLWEKVYCISFAILAGVLVSILTWWIIMIFIPIFGRYSLIPAVFNGIIFSIPLIIQYEKFRII